MWRRNNYRRHIHKHISGKLFRSFFYPKLPYYSRFESNSIYLKEPIDFMGMYSKNV